MSKLIDLLPFSMACIDILISFSSSSSRASCIDILALLFVLSLVMQVAERIGVKV